MANMSTHINDADWLFSKPIWVQSNTLTCHGEAHQINNMDDTFSSSKHIHIHILHERNLMNTKIEKKIYS